MARWIRRGSVSEKAGPARRKGRSDVSRPGGIGIASCRARPSSQRVWLRQGLCDRCGTICPLTRLARGDPSTLMESRAAMQSIDKKTRAIVAERLRRFFESWKQQLASGVEVLWERVETKLNKD